MPGAVNTVFFDAGDTLFRLRSPLNALYAESINSARGTRFADEDVKSAMLETSRRIPMVSDGHFRYSDNWFNNYIEVLLGQLECPPPWNGITENLFNLFDDPATFNVFPDVRPCLLAIHALGLNTAVVSNWGYRLPKLFSRLGLADDFGIILASADVESEKPDEKIFRLALEATDAESGRTIHVGDDPRNDVEGARAAGLQSLLLDRKNTYPDREDRITSLEDLLPHLQNQRNG